MTRTLTSTLCFCLLCVGCQQPEQAALDRESDYVLKTERDITMEPCCAMRDEYNETVTYRWAVKTCDANDVCRVGILVLSGSYLDIHWLGEGELMGDLNLDGTVNFKDLAIMAQNWGK